MLRFAKDVAKAALDDSGLPYRQRLLMTRNGFKPSNYVLYDIGTNDLSDYAADRHWRALGDSNGRTANHVLGNKLLFHLALGDEIPMPTLFGYIASGRFVRAGGQRDRSRVETFPELLEREGALVVKPIDGGKGKQVGILTRTAPGEYRAEATTLDAVGLEAWLARQDNVLVTSRVRQSEYASRIFPDTANTVRVVMVADADGPFVLCACHRFGRSRTGAVDNFAAGGLLCGVDLETGVLGPALSNPGRGQRTLTWHDTHPDTGAAIAGTEVTGFAGLIDRLLRVCEAHPYLTYVGWDAVMTDDGPVFLEANCGSGLQLQAITPYLRNPRFARFMTDRGMRHDVRRMR